MRIAVLTSLPPSSLTLNEYGHYLSLYLGRQEDISTLILLVDKSVDVYPSIQIPGCEVVIEPCWEFNSYKNLKTVHNALKKTKPDAIFFNLQFMKFGDQKIPAALGLLLPFICKLKGLSSVVLLHNLIEKVSLQKAGFGSNTIVNWMYKMIGKVLTRMLLTADFLAVTLEAYKKVLETSYGAKNVLHIPHGTFEIETASVAQRSDDIHKVMTFGKFGTYKRVEILIEAVQELRKKTKLSIELVIAGTDNPNAEGYLASMAKKYHDVPQLTFTGYVPEDAVARVFQESSLVVFPYTSTTGSSGVLHQAAGYGKAVVMPNLGDLSLLIEREGYQGAFFDADDSKSLASALQRVLENDDYRKQLEMANLKASQQYPMDHIAALYVGLFKRLLSKKNHLGTVVQHSFSSRK